MFVKNGASKEALDMYTTLNLFKEAQELIKTIQEEGGEAIVSDDLVIKQAEHENINGNWKEAAKLYTNAKAYKQAI